MTVPERFCECCGRGGILLPVCGLCQRDHQRAESVARRRTNFVHGRYSSYANGCRCDDCRKAKATAQRHYRRHGTYMGQHA